MVLQNGLLGKNAFFCHFCPFSTKPRISKTDSIPLVFKCFLIAYDGLSANKNVDNFIFDFFILDFFHFGFFILDFHFWIVFDFDFF